MNGDEERFPLDDAAIAILAELRESARTAQIASEAIVHYFARQHGITCRFQIAENRRELILLKDPVKTEV